MRKLGLLNKSNNNSEEEKMRKYLSSLKEECGTRLLAVLFNPKSGALDITHWISLGKKPFLG